MNTTTTMGKLYPLLTIFFSVILFIGCQDQTTQNNTITETELSEAVKAKGNGGETAYTSDAGTGTFAGYTESNCPDYGNMEFTLWAGKTNNAGSVTISNDDEYIYVNYQTNETADLGEVHVYVWTDAADIPSKRPAPGHADYIAEDLNADSYTIVIPAAISCGDTYYISTHAALVNDGEYGSDDSTNSNAGETAYAGGSNTGTEGFPNGKGAWWGYVSYQVSCYFDVSGSLYNDANNSADMESGESTFEGLTVNLMDADQNVIASTSTDANGNYLFEHVAGGADYSVSVVAGPEGDYLANENASGYSITDLGECVYGVDFGYVPLYDLSGNVYDDANNNSDNDNEAGIDGVVVNLYDSNGTLVASTTTDSNGNYSFENLLPGDYSVVVENGPIDYDATENANGASVSLSADTAGVDFGFYQPIVEPPTFDPCDTNEDGIVDAEETAVCDGDGTGGGMETAYAFGNQSFCGDYNLTRWGWVNNLTGLGFESAVNSVVVQDIWAGAGQCDTSKATKVGTVTIEHGYDVVTNEIVVTVSYQMDAGYYMNATHTWVSESLPNSLIANGKFTVVHENNEVTSDEAIVRLPNSSTGFVPFYVIAHMEVGGF